MKILMSALCIIFALSLSSCTDKETVKVEHMTSAGNIQNGGYVINFCDYYVYANIDDNNNLYKSSIDGNEKEKISGGHYFYEMNFYNNQIYYVSGSPGEIWKLSVGDLSKKRLVNQKVGNLLLYNGHMYYRLSEDNDWGKLFCADLNGANKKLLAERVNNFCIYDDLIYYFDINNNALCSMNIDGTESKVINYSYVNNIIVQNNMLIYSDHNRNDKLYSYDLRNNIEKCISEDMCWDLNGNEEWIFYRNQSDGGSLYGISLDGKIKHKIIDKSVFDILVVGDIVFYKEIGEKSAIKHFNITDISGNANGDETKRVNGGLMQTGTCKRAG